MHNLEGGGGVATQKNGKMERHIRTGVLTLNCKRVNESNTQKKKLGLRARKQAKYNFCDVGEISAARNVWRPPLASIPSLERCSQSFEIFRLDLLGASVGCAAPECQP